MRSKFLALCSTLLCIGAITTIFSSPVHAGKCVSFYWTPQEHIERATAIFRGTVRRIDEVEGNATMLVSVDTVWKGTVSAAASVFVPNWEPMFGQTFGLNRNYTFFGDVQAGTIIVSRCMMQPYAFKRGPEYDRLLAQLGARQPTKP